MRRLKRSSHSADSKVVFAGPPLSQSGGIGRMTQNVLEALQRLADSPQVRTLDTRGSRTALESLFRAMLAATTLVWWRLSWGKFTLHVNLSSRTSTVRKALVATSARLIGLPVVIHLHGSEYREFYGRRSRIGQALIRLLFANAKRIIVLGEVWKQFALDELKVSEEKVVVMPNAVPAAETAPVANEGGPVNLLFLGRVGERKGTFRAFGGPSRTPLSRVSAGSSESPVTVKSRRPSRS